MAGDMDVSTLIGASATGTGSDEISEIALMHALCFT